MTAPRSLSQLLEDLSASLTGERVSVHEILEAFHERGFGFLILLFALPGALPVPGLNAVFGLPLLVLTVQQALGRHTVWMPDALRRRSLHVAGFRRVIRAALPWIARAEIFIRPRLALVTQSALSRLTGLCAVLMAFSVALPIPLTNTVPGIGLALMAAGTIMRDGLAVVAGICMGMGWIALLGFLVVFMGTEGLDAARAFLP